jgi:hypothetical protein
VRVTTVVVAADVRVTMGVTVRAVGASSPSYSPTDAGHHLDTTWAPPHPLGTSPDLPP